MLAGHLGNYSRYEIEKKFIVKYLPDFFPKNYVDIEDTYLIESSLRLRVEKSSDGDVIGRKLTKKDRAPEMGNETTIITSLYLSEKDYISLGKLSGASLRKRRYTYQNLNQRIVCDIFQGKLSGLIMIEVEFKDYESLENFELKNSDWQEVTGNPKYSGGYLAFNSVAP